MIRLLLVAWLVLAPFVEAAAPIMPTRKIVLIAGKKSHGPVGNGIHDYGWSVKLLHAMLERSNVSHLVKVEHHLDGWPRNPATLENADCIMIVSDGRDGKLFSDAPHLATPERVRFVDRLMKRGCGLVTFHFSTFAPEALRDKVLSWNGGYFQWEQGGARKWYSAIRTIEAEVSLPSPRHPVARGLKPFKLREEFYYDLRLAPGAVPLAEVPALKGRKGNGNVVAWALQRKAGRGFGTTCGHFYDNWKNDSFRKMMLNGIVWASGAEVPVGGVESKFLSHAQITKALARRPTTAPKRARCSAAP